MTKPLIMTPGPTEIHEDVRQAMARPITNPDLDPAFFDFYAGLSRKLASLIVTDNEVLILAGEGILGLEAACASMIEPGDRVLCLDNGIFGHGFGDFVRMYGGECIYFSEDDRSPLDVTKLAAFLDQDSEFKLCTMVHCETPSGLLNPIEALSPLVKRYGILTVVDAVSSIGGESVKSDEWDVDVLLGGSQKCLSAAPGLTFMSVSPDAWSVILNRRRPITGFYCNLSVWKGWRERKWFPYTQAVSDLYGLDVAVDRVLADTGQIRRHQVLATAVRASLVKGGLELFPRSGWSNTVTAFVPPMGVPEVEIRRRMLKKHGILIAGAFGRLEGKVLRIGHMGENCREEYVYRTMSALDTSLREMGHAPAVSLHLDFRENLGAGNG